MFVILTMSLARNNATRARVHSYTSSVAVMACKKFLCLVSWFTTVYGSPYRQSRMLRRRKTLPIEMIVRSAEYPSSTVAPAAVVADAVCGYVRTVLTYRNNSVFRVKSVKID